MPIEFSCPQCLHPQKVDENKVGQQVYCRVCYFKLTVPAESTKPVDESQLYTLDAKPWDKQDKQELISLQCTICRTNIGVRKEQVGEEIICAECGTKIIVPKSIAEIAEARLKAKRDKAIALTTPKETYSLNNGTTVPSNDGPKQFRFSCQLCGTALFATEEQIDTLVSCPDCETKTKVPPQTIESKPSPLPPSTFEGTTAYNIATPFSVAPQENLVPVVCRFCGTRMYAEESQIGQFKTCPDCEQQTEIKAVPKPRKKTTSTTSADAYVLNNAGKTTPRPAVTFLTSLSPSILRRRLNEWESYRSLNRPPLPKRPLTERFFVPFGDPGTWLPLIVFVASCPFGALILYLYTCLMEGLAGVGVLIMTPILFCMFVAVFCYLASLAIHLYSLTSSGMDEGEYRGEIAPADYFTMGFWLFAFSFIATIPGFFIGRLFISEAPWIVVMMHVSHWFFFPIFFLSSMEVGSMFAVLAKDTVASLFRQPFAWFRFYALTGMLFVLADLCFTGAAWLGSMESMLLFVVALTLFFFLFAIQSLFYFRLLGRLAWLLEETYRRKHELEDEDE